MSTGFPYLPGFAPTQDLERNNFKKTSFTRQEKNTNKEDTDEIVDYPLPPEYVIERGPVAFPAEKEQQYLTTTASTFRPFMTAAQNSIGQRTQEVVEPQHVKYDRHVLRFYGYFKESVTESNLESSRVRRLIVFFYLVDNTLSIDEIKQVNSGIPQGVFLKRQNVPHPNEPKRFLTAYDLQIGEYLEVFGRQVKLIDCDTYTRRFYENLGSPQPEKQDYEIDQFASTVLPKFKPKDWYGLNSSVLNGKVPSQKQFLANDRKVLRFYVTSEIPYIVHYYLADDTMEVEKQLISSGRGDFSLLLKRQKFPKKFKLDLPGHNTGTKEFIRDSDISAGCTIEVFGRKFQVLGCDQFTQRYYKEAYEVDFPLAQLGGEDEDYNVEFQVPPYNHFGNEEDSLSNCYRLVPKPAKKDYFKWVDNQIQLRFTAVMNAKRPEDFGRRFVITFYLNDDNLMIYEPVQRNSGIVSGKFLEKGKYKNVQAGSRYFEPQDFHGGQDVIINTYSFRIENCDERTRQWYIQNIGNFDVSN